MKTMTKILGNRIAVRKVEGPFGPAVRVLKGQSAIVTPENVKQHGPYQFEADVVAVGEKLTEDIKVGDRVLVDHRGEQEAMFDGQPCELVSVLAVAGIIA